MIVQNALALRLATLADADVLLAWRNDPATRAASHHTEAVGQEEHVAWLARTLANPSRQLYVAEENGIPVGTVRADYEDGCVELSWTVAPEARRRGVGTRMVSALAAQIPGHIRAEIKVGNIASVRIAEAAGMALVRQIDGILHYARPTSTSHTYTSSS